MTTIKIITDIQEEIEKKRLEIESLEQGKVSIQFVNINCSEEEKGNLFALIQNRENRVQELLKKLESIQLSE